MPNIKGVQTSHILLLHPPLQLLPVGMATQRPRTRHHEGAVETRHISTKRVRHLEVCRERLVADDAYRHGRIFADGDIASPNVQAYVIDARGDVLGPFEPERADACHKRRQVVQHAQTVRRVTRRDRPAAPGEAFRFGLLLEHVHGEPNPIRVGGADFDEDHVVQKQHHRGVEDVVQVRHRQLAGDIIAPVAPLGHMPSQAQVASRGISALQDIVAVGVVIDIPGDPDQISADV